MKYRINCFRGRVGWQGWNPDPAMEASDGRLPGSGSFYWPSAKSAWRQGWRWLRRKDVDAFSIETISGRKICFARRNAMWTHENT
jgi:uncharacterized protein (DUF1684 family)